MNPLKPEITVRGERTDISQTPETDAEGQVLRRHVYADVPAGPGAAGVVSSQGTVPAILEYKTQVGEMANAVKTSCAGCRHHDARAWRKYIEDSTGPASTATDRQTIQALRDRLVADNVALKGLDGKFDEASLFAFGICRPLSDWVEGIVGRNPMHWPVAPESHATCPSYIQVPGARMEVVTAMQPVGLFKARDLDARKVGDKRRDALLFAASKK